jgi:carbonic anhydrase/acetyltransferase-like protein (isoleucine patch superfamily)
MIKLKQRINWIIREYKFGIEFGNDSAVFSCNKRKVELEEYEEIKNKLIQEISTEDDFSNSNQHKSSDIEEQLYFYTVTSEVNNSEESLHFSFNDSASKIEITHTYPENFDKYCILEEGKKFINNHVYPIMAMRTFLVRDHILVIMGEIGGWVEKEENLSHEGGCWVFHKARVYGNAQVLENACVYNLANIFGNAIVKGYARLLGSSYVYGNAIISGHSELDGRVSVGDDSKLSGNVSINNNCQIHGDSVLDGDVYLGGSVQVHSAKLTGDFNLTGAFTINFDISSNEDVAGYVINRKTSGSVSPIYSHIYLLASTKEDIWTDRDFKGIGEDLIEYFSRIDPERIGYYCNLVEFHKKQYNL